MRLRPRKRTSLVRGEESRKPAGWGSVTSSTPATCASLTTSLYKQQAAKTNKKTLTRKRPSCEPGDSRTAQRQYHSSLGTDVYSPVCTGPTQRAQGIHQSSTWHRTHARPRAKTTR